MNTDLLTNWQETLTRSQTVRALLIYLSACWLILQVTGLFTDQFGLPGWVFRGVLVLLSLGLLVILLSAYAHERQRRVAAAGSEQPFAEPQDSVGVEDPVGEPHTPSAAPGPVPRWLSWRNISVAGVAALSAWGGVAALYMGSRALGVGPAATLISRGTVSRSDQVLIADFTNRTRDPELGQTVAQALAVDLGQSKLVRVVSQQDTAAALGRMNRSPGTSLTPAVAREVAVREGIEAVVEGSVASLGPATLVTARLVSANDGEVLVEVKETAETPRHLLGAVDSVSGELRRKIGESLKVLRAEAPLEQVTTSSLPALKLYTQAVQAFGAYDLPKAVALLDQAVDLDPNFAMAWGLKAAAVMNSGVDPAGGAAALTRAYLNRHRLTERERGVVVGFYHSEITRDYPSSLAAYAAVAAAYPSDWIALLELGRLNGLLQNERAALAYTERAVTAAPNNFVPLSNYIYGLVYEGRFAHAEAAHAEALKRFTGTAEAELVGLAIPAGRGDYRRAYAIALAVREKYAQDPPTVYAASRCLAALAMTLGRFDEAEGRVAEMVKLNEARGLSAAALVDSMWLVDSNVRRGRGDQARARLQEALSRYPLERMAPGERPYWSLAEAYAALGDTAQAHRLLSLAETEKTPLPHTQYELRSRILGLIAMAAGAPGEAAEHFARASRFGYCVDCVLPDLGAALEAAARPLEAEVVYERYRSRRSEEKPHLGFVLERLRTIRARRGDARMASAHVSELDGLWREADPDLRRRVEAARRLAGSAPPVGPT
jgi:tetratricopeptide (TPR) repeat protein/TolB-like protein